MNEREILLDEARRIAGQPTGDKLDGKRGSEAYDVILRLLEETGLDYADALKLVGAFQWQQWRTGYESGRDAYKDRRV